MTKQHRPGIRRGDTLIEVIFALALLTSLLVIALSGALLAWRNSLDAAYRTQATYLAERQIAALQSYSDSLSWSQFTGAVATAPVDMSVGTYINGPCSTVGSSSCATNAHTGGPSATNPAHDFIMLVSGSVPPPPYTTPSCGTPFTYGTWVLAPISGGNNVEKLSSSSTSLPNCGNIGGVSAQNTLSSAYTVTIYTHQVNAGDNSQLRFDVSVTWPSLVRRANGASSNSIDEIVYLSTH